MLNCCQRFEKLMEPSGSRSLFPMCTNVRSCSTRPLKQKCSSHYYSTHKDPILLPSQHINTVQSQCLWSNGTDTTVRVSETIFNIKCKSGFKNMWNTSKQKYTVAAKRHKKQRSLFSIIYKHSASLKYIKRFMDSHNAGSTEVITLT